MNAHDPHRDALSIPHVAELLDVSRTNVYDLIARGELAATRVGGRMRVRAAEVERYLADNTYSVPRRRGRRGMNTVAAGGM